MRMLIVCAADEDSFEPLSGHLPERSVHVTTDNITLPADYEAFDERYLRPAMEILLQSARREHL